MKVTTPEGSFDAVSFDFSALLLTFVSQTATEVCASPSLEFVCTRVFDGGVTVEFRKKIENKSIVFSVDQVEVDSFISNMLLAQV